jgi:hypothetical protein
MSSTPCPPQMLTTVTGPGDTSVTTASTCRRTASMRCTSSDSVSS